MPSKRRISGRPVAARASRTAVPTASEPLFAKRTISTEGTASITFSAASASSSWGSPKTVPRSVMALTTAAVTSGLRWPSNMGPRPSR